MKKFYFLVAAALMSLGSIQAQTTIVSLGFEDGDATGKSSQYSLTPGLSTFGDWVNVQDVDEWNEKFDGEPWAGNYCFQAVNGDPDANSWDRGFKIAQLHIKENTPYRVSFWVKGPDGGKLSSWLSQGIENFDKSICTPSGRNFGLDQVTLSGEWQHMSFVSYYANADVLNTVIEGQSWVGGSVFPENFGGDGTETYKEHFGGKLPEEFFFVANMFSAGEYLLDDIKIEEGMTFNEATFFSDVIKLDFGFQTNIAELAKANGGYLTLDPSCVSVKIDGTEAPVEFVEGMTDGFVYIFLNEVYAEPEQNVTVSFTPADDCPIRITGEGTTEDTKLVGFQNETAYAVESIDVVPSAWSPAIMVSSNPENESFELDPATFKNISVTYNKGLDLTYASATLSKNGVNTDLTNAMSLSEDRKTINIAVSNLADGEYTLTVAGVANSYGVECEGDLIITFAVGEDSDTSISEVIYASDFDNEMTGGIPQGWVTYNSAGFHIYGFNDEERTSQFNYNWGGNPGGGGARLYDGFSGDFIKAMYWGSRDTNEGYAEYGSQVKDWILEDGSLDPEMPEGIALQLEPRKYQISFVMAAWKGEPVFRFTLEDLQGNVYAKFNDFVAKPNMNGATGAISGSLKCTTDFSVDKAGFYVLRFAAQDAQWQEFLLANVKLITMPSKAAYWKQQLAVAREAAEEILATAEGDEYDGETKTAFVAAINSALNDHFTAPSQVEAMIAQLKALGEKMQVRVSNINDFNDALVNAANAYEELEGKYLEAEIAVNAKALLDNYEETNPSDLGDEELAEVTPKLVTAAAQLANVKSVVDILVWGGYKAFVTATTLGADGSAILDLISDDREVIDDVNIKSTIALYEILAASNGEIADSLKTTVNWDGSYIVVDDEYVTTNPDEVAVEGIDFTGLIQNPHFYTFGTNSGANLEDNTIVGWYCTQLKNVDEEGNVLSQGSLHFSGDAATDAKPVSDVMINAYGGGGEYIFYQTLSNVPVGVYDVWIGSRTASGTYGDNIFEPYNAMNDETGLWDKYIFAQVDEADGNEENAVKYMTPFAIGGWGVHPTVIKNVTVKEGQTLTIGVCEHYTSGKASKGGEARDFWDTNTFADDARLYFVAPVEGYDYAAAAKALVDGVEDINTVASRMSNGIYSISGVRMNGMQKGVNIVRRADGSVSKILVK